WRPVDLVSKGWPQPATPGSRWRPHAEPIGRRLGQKLLLLFRVAADVLARPAAAEGPIPPWRVLQSAPAVLWRVTSALLAALWEASSASRPRARARRTTPRFPR